LAFLIADNADSRDEVNQPSSGAMLAILHLLGTFVVNLFKSQRRLEIENVFLRHQLNIALRRAPQRLRLRGCDRALLLLLTWLWPSCSVCPAWYSLTRSRGGIETGFGPIGAGNLGVGQGCPELAVSCAK
jgi:hypothetical protein